MPNIASELSDARCCNTFAAIDFCSEYWQAPLHPESQPLFAFMTLEGVVILIRTTQGKTNSAANFQENVEDCFNELRQNFKAWLDDFILVAVYGSTRRKFEDSKTLTSPVLLGSSAGTFTEQVWYLRVSQVSLNGQRLCATFSNLSTRRRVEAERRNLSLS